MHPKACSSVSEYAAVRVSAVAATFALVGVLLGLWYPAAGIIFAFFSIAGIILFSGLGLQRHMMTIRIEGDYLILAFWFAHQKILLTAIDSIGLRTTLIGRSLAHTMVFWKGNGEEIAVVATSPFPKQRLQALLKTIQAEHPRLQIDRELQRFLTTA